MSEPIVSAGGGGLKAPSNVRELAALALAFVACVAASYGVSLVVDRLDSVPEHLRGYINGLPLGGVLVVRNWIDGLLGRMTGAGPERPDLPPWFVTGLVAGALLFAWNWFAQFLMKFTVNAGFESAYGAGLPPETYGAGIETAAAFNANVLTALGAIYAGTLLNRFTRSGVFLALALCGFSYIGLQFGVSYALYPSLFDQLFASLMANPNAEGIAGAVVGILLFPVAVILLGLVGVGWSALNRERSLGRLANAARRLSTEDRNAVLDDMVTRIARD